MKNLEKYVRELTKRVKINARALKISEKGVSMEVKKQYGFTIDEIRCGTGDAILKIETTGLDPNSQLISVGVIDENGLTLITADDPDFERKVKNKIRELDGKRIFVYHREFTLGFMRRYVSLIKYSLVDLKNEMPMIYGPSAMSVKRAIEIPWDRVDPEDVPVLWNNGNIWEVKIHAVAECMRLYILYMHYLAHEYMNISPHSIPMGLATPSTTRVQLPAPNWNP